MNEAGDVLAESPHPDLPPDALAGLSTMTPPASPHHCAMPLLDQGVDVEYCFDVVWTIGLIDD